MKVLSLSDTQFSFIYSPQVRDRFKGVDLILGCGDLPYYYLEYVYDALGSPLFYVRGNHDKVVEYTSTGQYTCPQGGIDLHRKTAIYNGLILAGVEGSLKYRSGSFLYTQNEMWMHVFRLVPALFINRLRYGRFVDVVITLCAEEVCPLFPHPVHKFHWPLPDPAKQGTLEAFREVREELQKRLSTLFA